VTEFCCFHGVSFLVQWKAAPCLSLHSLGAAIIQAGGLASSSGAGISRLDQASKPTRCDAALQARTEKPALVDYHGRFVWYELMTTDVAAAKAFYGNVIGWSAQDASTPDLTYTLFTAGKASVSGLMDLPDEARKMGATPRWMGYVGVNDVDVAADRVKRLGGAVYVPPTNSNIGRISVIADPQTATLALVGGKPGRQQLAELSKPGHVGWHALFATDWDQAFAFYAELFGWQRADAEIGPAETYQLFSAGGQTIGGMFTKPATDPVPYWHFYFNVGDIDAAAERVKDGGGRVFEGPLEVPGDSWIARCADPQGAAFALQGKRRQQGIGWSSKWDGISTKGRLVTKARA
jgi:predicted enzyme related to lactoylglutathione lyase